MEYCIVHLTGQEAVAYGIKMLVTSVNIACWDDGSFLGQWRMLVESMGRGPGMVALFYLGCCIHGTVSALVYDEWIYANLD
ncbi:uncharacterized protein BDW43DRAFT_281452 [Aspergillus alliaceus]|uniref:uncharacterized protein n=1 Tax=Petromyces alliaceus TaxID=209559 RepID=UPI0012A56538|nr:uncharacterized protein BDW43DRAFT_281452 [Aspergillus alliaceus]KAB8231725.1 hypothetical protein BDW43DRAFT_281452 [Aspergillus alliaceus]